MRETRHRAAVTAPETVDDIIRMGEWNNTEFKAARRALPKSVFESISAFANTRGGWLVLGVSQAGEGFELTGVERPDQIQNDLLSTLNAGGKLNHDVDVDSFRYTTEAGVVLAFFIHENPRTRKPVYLDGDLRRTFVRRGGGDFKVRPHELYRMIRDADRDRWGAEPFTRVALDEVFHSESIRWYRSRFYERNPGHDTARSELDFLQDWGFVVRDGGELLPTGAAVALFGSLRGVHTLLSRPILDLQFLSYGRGAAAEDVPWIDRFLSEQNIIQTWQQLLAKYLFFMPKSFSGIDPRTLERRDAPAGFRVFREAAMNLLIHQDYGDDARVSKIQFFVDGVYLWNPGDSFTDLRDLMQPGEKEVRNPALAGAMQRIALCERAGTGLRMIDREWTKLGHPRPSYDSDREHKSFSLFLPEMEFTPAPRDRRPRAEPRVGVALDIDPELLTDSVRELVLSLGGREMSRKQLQDALQLSHRRNFTVAHLRPLLRRGIIELTLPDTPRSPHQRYRLSALGEQLLGRLRSGELEPTRPGQ